MYVCIDTEQYFWKNELDASIKKWGGFHIKIPNSWHFSGTPQSAYPKVYNRFISLISTAALFISVGFWALDFWSRQTYHPIFEHFGQTIDFTFRKFLYIELEIIWASLLILYLTFLSIQTL